MDGPVTYARALRGEIPWRGPPPSQPLETAQPYDFKGSGGDDLMDQDGLKLKLELNIDIEVELKASIHGDLTLALLDVPPMRSPHLQVYSNSCIERNRFVGFVGFVLLPEIPAIGLAGRLTPCWRALRSTQHIIVSHAIDFVYVTIKSRLSATELPPTVLYRVISSSHAFPLHSPNTRIKAEVRQRLVIFIPQLNRRNGAGFMWW